MEVAAAFNPTIHLARSYTGETGRGTVGGGGKKSGGRGGGGRNNSVSSSGSSGGGPLSRVATSNSTHATHHHTMSTSSQPSLAHQQGHTSSSYSIQSQPSSRSSDTTQGTSASTLFAHPPLPPGAAALAQQNGAPMQNGDVTATDNIMNSVADASSSLFQICVTLRQRLMGVPGFREFLVEEEDEADEDTDPVTLLWRTFRRGIPLMMLYNALNPAQPLKLSGIKEEKIGKAATFKFLQACVNDLKFPQEECFIVTDLYGNDTTGFVKVARVVNRVLDILVQRGLVDDVRPTASDFEQAEKGMKRTQRQHIVSELVTTERTYVQHLELLQAFKHLVEEKGIIHGDAVHDIFLNLNALLDFQRRFLIRVEQTNAQPEEEQNWGRIFISYYEAFKVYEPYIANQRKCEKTVVAEYAKLKDAGGSLEMRQMVESPTSLYGFLMKPFQRLSKYPLLLEDLYKKGDLDEERRKDLKMGKEAATSILTSANLEVDRQEKVEAVQELKMRVEDWKGHRVEGFGELLLYGTFTVLKSENLGSGKDGERQYHVYLFETILLCCKDIDPTKPKNKLSNKQLVDRQSGKVKLQLKGRIFMQNVTDLVSASKPGMLTFFDLGIRSAAQIFWKGDPGIENFVIRFTTEEVMKKWATQIEMQRRRYREHHSSSGSFGGGRATARNSDGSRQGGTSVTEFNFMRDQPALENPYKNADEYADEEEDEVEEEPKINGHAAARNASNGSLRAQPPRFQPGTLASAPLTLRTQQLQGHRDGYGLAMSPASGTTPGTASIPQESYFSPLNESPMSGSQRTSNGSSSMGMYPFPRQNTTPNGAGGPGYYNTTPEEEAGYARGQARFTAPAMAGRQREVSNASSASSSTAGTPRPGPTASQQGTRGMHSAQQLPMPPRNRSASSPDIHNQRQPPYQRGQSPAVPEVPAQYGGPIYPSLGYSAVPRSQNSSPAIGLPRMSPAQQPPPLQQRTTNPYPASAAYQPPAPPHSPPTNEPPSQLKVRVICPSASQTLTLVVPLNISYQSLKDRIDAKLQRSTNLTLGDKGPREGMVKLKYEDEQGDFVSITSDEDVREAFEWGWERSVGQAGGEGLGGMGEVELFCQR